MKRAGLAGLIAVVIAVAFWATLEHGDGNDRPRSKVSYRDGRSSVAPRRTAVREVDPIAASAEAPGRIEGRVIGPEGQPVVGATVVLEPPVGAATLAGTATAITAADGRFAFTRLERRSYALSASTPELVAGPIRAVADERPGPVTVRLAAGGFDIVTVVDGDGRPVAGALVHVRGIGSSMSRATDTAGKTVLGPLQPGWVSIAVEASGHTPTERAVSIAPLAQPIETTIVLQRGVSVSARVVDERHAPIAEARVTVSWSGGASHTPILTNERGEVTVPALARGTYRLRATDDEHAPATSTPVVLADAPIDGIELMMTDGGVISGVVLDGDRKPVPLATVIARDGDIPREVITDASGAFELRGMGRNFSTLRAETATSTSRTLYIALSENVQADVELVLDGSGIIAGTVVDERGAPLAGIIVSAAPDWTRLPPRTGAPLYLLDAITDADGAFVFHGPLASPYQLHAHRRSGVYRSSRRSTPATMGDHDVRIQLVPEGRITGRIVVDRLDAPPSGVRIDLGGAPPALIGGDGSFQIAEVPPGPHDLWFNGTNFLPFQQLGVEVRSGETTDVGTLTALRSRILVGRVVDRSGAPANGARVEIGVIRLPPVDVDDPPAGFHAYRTGVSAADGSFRIYQVPPAPMLVVASTQAAGSSEPVPVPGGSDTPGDPPPVTLVLSPAPETR